MCLILFAYSTHPQYKLVLAANRDEFYARPTLPAAYWEDAPNILAGKDLVAGGTWLGVTRDGRFAAVTNYRDPRAPEGLRSRGHLVGDFLREDKSAAEYLQEIHFVSDEYSGFNLILGEVNQKKNELFYYSNREGVIRNLAAGVYGLSNHLLDTPWHKVKLGKKVFSEAVNQPKIQTDALFEILQNRQPALDADLPDTGVGKEREKVLSPIFIRTDIYGTRCSTVLLIDNAGEIFFEEKVW
jgi:uncharacterized protein with NRDE domain